ncbi:leukocyte receptor cluster member 8 homolog [Lingula anatina]|uniref:Leukocyte receptor cluster member 8 homolog n=1 Tax=Lingula anatina TaxID=7574 RepID=A0A1S3JAZ8_LINAN|nr:leukocyte receptor cluster member 8 homolog [Lingula anatina]|eukprot:XP_013407575.1 leukocyte receptor cluster member 8 homolog [Lingula anatina]
MGLFLLSGIILCKVWQRRTQGAVLQTVTAAYDPEGQPQFTAGAQPGTTVYFNTPHGTTLTYQSDGANLSGTATSSNQDSNAGAPPSYWDITQQDLQNGVQQNAQSGSSVYNGPNPEHQYNPAQPSPGELSPGQPSQYAAHSQDTSQTEQINSQPQADEYPPQYVPPTGEGQPTEAPPIFEGPPPEAPPPTTDGQEHLPAPPTYEEAQAL